MQEHFIEYISLIFFIVTLVMLANSLKVAYPIILVLGGLALSTTALFSEIAVDPEMIFFIFLPPLLYEAAWQTSWKDFWKWRRVIVSFAFPIVMITSCVVAFSSSALIPGFTLAFGFLLGGIVSPPDAISATTIMRQVKVPKGLMTIAEGESLLNDASALIVFRFALLAIVTGQFSLGQAIGDFFLVITMGILIGVAVALVFYAIYKYLPTTVSIEIILSFLAPYCMYYFAERFHFSGVLAVVAGGLLLSSQRHTLLSYQGRMQGSNVWSTIGFVMNGIVFMLIGLELPNIISGVEEVSLSQAVWYGIAISLVLIVTRIICAIGASVFTRFMSRFITVADSNPGWRMPFVFGWSGMRGVVSLAAALSIPVLIEGDKPFPYRNLILIITFIVILVTLVFQGLTLPWVIRKMKLVNKDEQVLKEQEQELKIRKAMAESSLKYLDDKQDSLPMDNIHITNLKKKLSTEFDTFQQDVSMFNGNSRDGLMHFHNTYLSILESQRKALHELNRHDDVDDELIRKYLSLIDLEETKMREVSFDHAAHRQ